ncbi:WD40-repeat-containing domain protein [Roridomyces roridus]|uniref:WD40-repeat-containing domain protein n=1 Tax=Roridomyces roridus TaxID=1738132 RepID=A0AAD7AYN5_9AGAR|nr:WD40-repeat-containing domain protein [Roridomyces roridus]
MIQTGLIANAHNGMTFTDASYDYYGLRLATCSLDQRIKIWQLDETNGSWTVEDDWKAHDAAVSKVSWAHPEFGVILASSSFDRTVKVWEQTSLVGVPDNQQVPANGNPSASGPSTSRWIERAVLPQARGTVRAVEFGPHHFGLKLATISSDNHLRIYECLEQPSLTTWQLSEEADVQALPISPSISPLTRAQQTNALATPTQTSGSTADGVSAPLIAQALQQGLQQSTAGVGRPGLGNREADGGWCISWCKDRYWGELIAAGSGTSGVIKIIQLLPSNRPTTILTLDPSPQADIPPVEADGVNVPATSAITSVSWAPSCGRSYHLIATGGRDGHVRIWRVKPGEEGEDDMVTDGEEGRWTATMVADFEQHKSAVGRVEWNITGTVLSSAGNDGRIRLWKATSGNVWRPAGSIGVEQSEEPDTERPTNRDVDMDS